MVAQESMDFEDEDEAMLRMALALSLREHELQVCLFGGGKKKGGGDVIKMDTFE